jgi:hypothetical protein
LPGRMTNWKVLPADLMDGRTGNDRFAPDGKGFGR